MLFMSMGLDSVSELRPPPGLVFIPKMIIYMSAESHGGMILTGEK
jgi:hypothetical protein